MFDTHCHLNFKRFKKTLPDVITRAHEAGVDLIVVPGTDVNTSKKAVEITREHSSIYAAVGIHPHHAYHYLKQKNNPQIHEEIETRINEDLLVIEELLREPTVIAIGEVGMDRHTYEETVYQEYSVSPEFIQIQEDLLKMQIKIAIKHNKSLILHNREAKNDILTLLEENWDSSLEGRAVLHCCEADHDLLRFAQLHKMYIGIDGDVTYDQDKKDFIKHVPMDMLVLETDSPFILPEPLKSQKKYPNEPAYVSYVAAEVAQIKNIAVNDVIEQTTDNGKKLFGLQESVLV